MTDGRLLIDGEPVDAVGGARAERVEALLDACGHPRPPASPGEVAALFRDAMGRP